MVDENSKKQIEEEMAAQQEAAIKKKEEEQQAIEQSENIEAAENAAFINQEIIVDQQEQLQQEEQSQQETTVPTWVKDAVYLEMEYETEKAFGDLDGGSAQDVVNTAGNTLSDLAESNIIADFVETVQGVKAVMNMEGGQSIHFNLENNRVETNAPPSKEVLETITSVVSNIGGSNLDVSSLKDSESRFNAFKSADEKNLSVTGLQDDEKDQFKSHIEAGLRK